MPDELITNLLQDWSGRVRLSEAELSQMLNVTMAVAPSAPPFASEAWIDFWQQIGRLIRIEQRWPVLIP